MAPSALYARAATDAPDKATVTLTEGIVEAWAEGFNFGAIIILILLLFCNMKRHVLLHKLILLEVTLLCSV